MLFSPFPTFIGIRGTYTFLGPVLNSRGESLHDSSSSECTIFISVRSHDIHLDTLLELEITDQSRLPIIYIITAIGTDPILIPNNGVQNISYHTLVHPSEHRVHTLQEPREKLADSCTFFFIIHYKELRSFSG